MNISQALKQKNRLAGEVALLRSVIAANNRRPANDKPEFDIQKLLADLMEKTERLARIKAAIARANLAVLDDLNLLAELRGHTLWFGAIPNHRGSDDTAYSSLNTRLYDAQLGPADILAKIIELKARIDEVQDRLDAHNAVTAVNFDN